MQTFEHHFGIVTFDDNITVTLNEVGSREENTKKIQQIVDYLILEMFIPVGNYRVMVSNDKPENQTEEFEDHENN
jgi:23S rRNA G2445 N2-methylase RlmL